MNRIARMVATGLYSGYFPIAPGTVGSAGALLVYLLFPFLREIPLLVISVTVFFIGVWASTKVEETDGHDASIINIDEVVGMWISLFFLPSNLNLWGWVAAFFIFRFFDIVKPFPIGRSQNLSKGWGIMVDDVLAGIYTFIVLQVAHFIV